MAMNFLPGFVARAQMRDDLRRLAASPAIRALVEGDLCAAWWLDDTQAVYAAVQNPAVATGRELVINGDFATNTVWTTPTGWTIASGVASASSAASSQNLSQVITGVVVGKSYQVSFTITNYVTGTVQLRFLNGGLGTSRSANGTYTETVVATSTSFAVVLLSTFTADVDNISVKQIDIPASSIFPRLNVIENGTFDFNYGFSGTNWAITGGKLAHTPGSTAGAAYNTRIVQSKSYDTTFTISGMTAGNVAIGIGGAAGTTRTANGTYTQTVVAGTTDNNVLFSPSSLFDGSIDVVSIAPTDGLLVGNGVFASDTLWTKGAGWTISGGVAVATTAAAGANLTQGGACPFGRTFLVTYTVVVTSGSVRIETGAGVGTTRSASGTYTEVLVNASATSATLVFRPISTFTGTIDDVVVTELPPMTGTFVNGMTVNQTTGNSLLDPVISDDGVNDTVNAYSGDLNSIMPTQLGTLEISAKVNAAGDWSDATNRNFIVIGDGSNNRVVLQKTTTTRQIKALYVGGGTNTQVTFTIPVATTDWFHIAMTWDVVNNVLTLWFNGVAVGTASTFGTWAANFVSTSCAIGSSGATGSGPWKGSLAQARLYNTAFAPDRVLLHAMLGGAA